MIASYVDAIVSGNPWVIWVEGDAGSGKTTLVRQALSGLSAEVRVLQATADELSADVEFAVVDQLGAIRGRSGFVAGLELLAHIGEAEDSGPVIVVVEDLHWAATASRQALLTLARRLDQDRVLMILTSRPGGAPDRWDRFRLDSGRCASISVGPLSVAEVAALAQAVGVPLGPGGAERLHRHTNGHPLYARRSWPNLTRRSPPRAAISSDRGFAAAFVAVTIIALAGMVLTAILVKRPNTAANRAGEPARRRDRS